MVRTGEIFRTQPYGSAGMRRTQAAQNRILGSEILRDRADVGRRAPDVENRIVPVGIQIRKRGQHQRALRAEQRQQRLDHVGGRSTLKRFERGMHKQRVAASDAERLKTLGKLFLDNDFSASRTKTAQLFSFTVSFVSYITLSSMSL